MDKKYPSCKINPLSIVLGTSFEGYNVVSARADVSNAFLGLGTYIGALTSLPNSKIGRFCSISYNVRVSRFTHPTNLVSTYPAFYNTNVKLPLGKGRNHIDEQLNTDNGYSVEIGNDVWIGENVLIKGGVKIGDGSIIGMGAVVTRDVPPYSIVGGVPAKIIRKRFDDKTINSLLKIKWWDWPIDRIKSSRDIFFDIETFLKNNGDNY